MNRRDDRPGHAFGAGSHSKRFDGTFDDPARGFRSASDITAVSPEEIEMSVARLEALAKVMDSIITIPGTNVRLGVDALLGLLPVIGDAISATISSYLIWEAKRLGVSRFLLARMAGNVMIDTVVGAVPLVGDVFDVAYRSNLKNIALLKKHIAKHGLGTTKNQTIEVDYARIEDEAGPARR